ncbi:MAG: hypothetical protein ACFE8U_09195 [Candidatus Hermodarchaeota archaeon]
MIKKKQVIITLFILIFLLNISQVVADDGYVLIIYYDFGGEVPTPGDRLTIKAELYKERSRVTDSVEVKIYGIDNLAAPISMVDDGKGIFSYELTIPSTVDDNDIGLSISAYINKKEIDSKYLSIEISEDEKAPSPPFNSVSHRMAAPGETVEVLTYIPDIEYGNLDSSEVSVTVDFYISTSSLESTEEKSTYIGDGFFSAVYTIPLDVVIEYDYYYTPHLKVDIHSEYSGDDFYDGFSINIGVLNLIAKAAFSNSELTLDVLVLDRDYAPAEGITINSQIELQNEAYDSEIIDLTLSNTDAHGRSTKTVEITMMDVIAIMGKINATKDNLCSYGGFFLNLHEDFWYDFFMLVPTEDYILNILENYEKGVSLDMIAYLGEKKLVNAEIDVYASWRGGINEIFTKETDNEGRLSIDIDWPRNFGSLLQDIMDITFVYNNGTDWFEYEFGITKPYDFEFNSGPIPVVNYNDYNDYQVVTVSYQLSSSVKMGSIYVMPFYKEYSLISPITSASGGPFSDTSGMFGFAFSKPTNGIISSQNIIDKAFTFEYMMITIQYPDSSAKMGFKYIIWVLDPNGVPIGGSQSQNIIGFDIFLGAVLFSSMITCVIFKRRKKLD